jgi:cyclohexanecarboxylate-CoA ligase
MVAVTVDAARRDAYRRAGHWLDRFVDSHVGQAAAARPEAVAVVDGRTVFTYADLDRLVGAAASGLRGLGIGSGDVVSWQLPNWHEALVLHHAVLRLGAVSNPIVPIYRGREVRYMLGEARSRVMVVPETFRGFGYAAMVQELQADLPDLEQVVVVRPMGHTRLSFDALIATGSKAAGLSAGEVECGSRSPDDPALLMFTSGTTADPKGVIHTHNTLDYENRSIIEVFGLGQGDVVFMASPVTHVTGLLYGLQLPAMLGVPVVLQDVWDADAALDLLQRHRCSFTVAATPFLHALVHHPHLPSHDLSALRVFGCGGADVPSALIRDAEERIGCRATRVYGSTEFPTLSTSPPDAPLAHRAATDGRPIGGAEYRILDEDDRDLPAGSVGELLVRGPEQFVGYLRPVDEVGAVLPDGWFRTGDLAVADDEGQLAIRGRKKDIILRGGENISVTEVEDLLVRHPAVQEIAVVAMPDPVMVERACAFVVPTPGERPALADLATFLIDQDVAKQKIPERLVLVAELPKTQSGKVQKFRLREQARAFTNGGEPPPASG